MRNIPWHQKWEKYTEIASEKLLGKLDTEYVRKLSELHIEGISDSVFFSVGSTLCRKVKKVEKC
jgi:hypothetical protein